MSLRILLLIGLGGFLGSVLRFILQQYTDRLFSTSFPIGIFLVNVLGSLLIGLIIGIAMHKSFLSDEMQLLLATGFCGGFTTFSAFSFDNLKYLQTSEYGLLLGYAGGSVILGVLATFLGIWLVRYF